MANPTETLTNSCKDAFKEALSYKSQDSEATTPEILEEMAKIFGDKMSKVLMNDFLPTINANLSTGFFTIQHNLSIEVPSADGSGNQKIPVTGTIQLVPTSTP